MISDYTYFGADYSQQYCPLQSAALLTTVGSSAHYSRHPQKNVLSFSVFFVCQFEYLVY